MSSSCVIRRGAPTHVSYIAVLLLLLTAGCASVTADPPVSQPQVVATEPAAAQPAAKPVAAATPQPEPASVPAPSVATRAPQAAPKDAPPVAKTSPPVGLAAQPAAPPVAAAPPLAPAAPLTLDYNTLVEQLKATKAIGIFTKISLRNQIGDLMKEFSDHYQSKGTRTMAELRRSYDLLIMKVLSLLQDADPKLAAVIYSSREAIWSLLADQKTFAALPT